MPFVERPHRSDGIVLHRHFCASRISISGGVNIGFIYIIRCRVTSCIYCIFRNAYPTSDDVGVVGAGLAASATPDGLRRPTALAVVRRLTVVVMPPKAASSRSRYWMYVLHATDDDVLELPAFKQEDLLYVYHIYQVERCPETKRRHAQGFVILPQVISFAALKARVNERIRLEQMKTDVDSCIAYCSKEETREPGCAPVEDGVRPAGQGKRSDLDAVKRQLDEGRPMLEVAQSNFGSFVRYNRGFTAYAALVAAGKKRQRTWITTAHVYWGPTGSGKTTTVRAKAPDAYWLSKPNNPTPFFDGYDGQEDVVIDEFYSWLPYDFVLRLLDSSPFTVATRQGSVNWVAKRVFFTSNQDPKDWYPGISNKDALKRRFTEVIHVPYTAAFPCATCRTFPHQPECSYVKRAQAYVSNASSSVSTGLARSSSEAGFVSQRIAAGLHSDSH